MKFFKYKENETKKVTHILLETKLEVELFLQNKNIFWQQDIDNFYKLILTEDEDLRGKLISHTTFRTPISRISKGVSTNLYDNKLQFNPLFFLNMYDKNMLAFIEKYGNVFVNENGGYCYFETFSKDDYEEVFGFDIKDLLSGEACFSFEYDSSENKVLVLENDPILDKWTVNNFKGRVPYILNLRTIMQTNKFEEILKSFVKNHSKKIFVYTTGLDYDQMIEYTNRSIDCGFEEFEWVFVGFKRGTEFEEFLKTKQIKYSLKNI
jgi:hypothetical protein